MCDQETYDRIKEIRKNYYYKAVELYMTGINRAEVARKLNIKCSELKRIEKDYALPSITLVSTTFKRAPQLKLDGREVQYSNYKQTLQDYIKKLEKKHGNKITRYDIDSEASEKYRKDLYKHFNIKVSKRITAGSTDKTELLENESDALTMALKQL